MFYRHAIDAGCCNAPTITRCHSLLILGGLEKASAQGNVSLHFAPEGFYLFLLLLLLLLFQRAKRASWALQRKRKRAKERNSRKYARFRLLASQL